LALSGAATMGNTLAVTGAATFQNNVTVNGNLTVLGSQTAINTTNLEIKDNAILLADGNVSDAVPIGFQVQYQPSGASAVKYAGMKRRPQTGEFVFFKDSATTIESTVSAPAAPVLPTPYIYLPFDNSLTDSQGHTTISSTAPVSYVAGPVGGYALNLSNVPAGTASHRLTGNWSGAANVTMSCWFNIQSPSASPQQQIFSAYTGALALWVSDTNYLHWDLPTGGADGMASVIAPIPLVGNTWYEVVCSFQTNGVCAMYLNHQLMGTYTNVGGMGTFITPDFSLGGLDNPTPFYAFNGYIDEFKIYHTAENTMIISPQQTGLSSSAWTQNGINWTASASSVNGSWSTYKAFNNTNNDGWLSSNSPSPYNGDGVVISSVAGTTTVLGGVGVLPGEWLQIQSSTPEVLSSFAFGKGPNPWPYPCLPQTYYIVGSTDGSNWYPIQSGLFSLSNITGTSSTILINYTGSQTVSGGMTGSVSTTCYSYSTNAYSYFRLIGTSIMAYSGSGSSTYMEIGEWYMNFLSTLNADTDFSTSASPYISLPFNNSLTDSQGHSTVTPYGSIAYVAGPTSDSYALNLVNTAGGTPANYVKGTFGSVPNFMLSLSFNLQSLPSNGVSNIFTMGTNIQTFFSLSYVNNVNYFGNGNITGLVMSYINSSNVPTLIGMTQASLSTWYSFNVSYQQSGTITAYLNGVRMGSVAGSVMLNTISLYTLGSMCHAAAQAMNGYISGFSLYNYVMLPSTLSAPTSIVVPVTVSKSYVLEWMSNMTNLFPINTAVTMPLTGMGPAPVAGAHLTQVQGYTLPAGSYTFTATTRNDDNYSNSVTLYDANENVINVVNPSGTARWSFGGPYSGSFTLANETTIYPRVGDNYYMYNTRITMNLTGVSAAAPSEVYAVVMADSFMAASDARLKNNIVVMESTLDKLDEMRGVYHDWVDPAQPQERQVGVIAQELQAVYPELVMMGGNGFLSVNYPKLTAVLLQSIKELKARVIALMK
jgi:hypothetical protein